LTVGGKKVTDTPAEREGDNAWAKLRRRKVVQWGLVYVAGAWGFLQGLEYLSSTYDWPRQIQQLATLALLIGLPLVLVLAWFHGDRGHQRITAPELAILTLLLLLGGGALWYYQGNSEVDIDAAPAAPSTSEAPTSATAPDARPTLAVLPFADLSQAQDQEYLGDGLAEEILNQLAQLPALRLVGRTSSFSFKGKDEDLRTIGGKLGVDHLLEGSVRKDGNQLRITAQLIRADDGTHLWSKTYARELSDMFKVQDEIAHEVAQALSVKLDAVTLNRAQGGTTHIEAYDRFLRWRQLLLSDEWKPEYERQRVQLAREAVAFDPGFVLGWDALATSLESLAFQVDGAQAEKLHAEVEQIRARIAELAPEHWSVKRERAYALWREGKRAEAIAVAKAIMDSGPLTMEHAYPYVNLIFSAGYLDETLSIDEQLRVIEPLSMYLSRSMQYDYIAARRYDEAEAEYQRSLSLKGDDTGPTIAAFHRMLARNDADLEALRARYRQYLQRSGGESLPPFFRDLGTVLHDRDAMRAILRKAAADATYGGDAPGDQSLLADALGETDLAASLLRKRMERMEGFKEGRMDYGGYWQLWIVPYSNLRAHPEFKKLLIDTGLVDLWRQTGKWGDSCKPVGTDDFQCQ
jgi:TolB-like protein/tetratricopeptide (TPR) repeat protein